MKSFARCFSLLCTACFLFSMIASPAYATNSLENHVLTEVTALYADYYYISDAAAKITESRENPDGSVTYLVDASFKRTLKETSAYDMPYIQGLMEAKALLSDSGEISRAENYINIWVAELENYYIGVAQDTNVTLSVTVPQQSMGLVYQDAVDAATICVFDNVFGETYPLESLRPRSDAEAKNSAKAAVANVLEREPVQAQATNASRGIIIPILSPIQHYDRVVARDYARDWSCNRGISYDHASCHNPQYDFIPDSDCANFVSQCIAEGGLPTDDEWNSDEGCSAWYTTGNNGYGLRDYMVDMDYFFHTTDDYDAFAGSIINLLKASGADAGHVGLVDQNDTRTMTFCSHTSCRRSEAFSFYSHRDFYVPVWDSETETWT